MTISEAIAFIKGKTLAKGWDHNGAWPLDVESSVVSGASLAITAALFQEQEPTGPVLWICPDEEVAKARQRELDSLCQIRVRLLPALGELVLLPLIPPRELLAARLEALYTLSSGSPEIVVTWAEALCEPAIPRTVLAGARETVACDDEIGRDILADWLADSGYEPVRTVRSVGEFAVRGGLVDVFSPGQELPVRLDFFGDTVESIRHFDPVTQRSVSRVDTIDLLPMTEFVLDRSRCDQAVERLIGQGAKLGISASRITETMQLLKDRQVFDMPSSLMPVVYSPVGRLMDYMAALSQQDEGLTIVEQPGTCLKNVEDRTKALESSWQEALEKERAFAPFEDYFLRVHEIYKSMETLRLVRLWSGDIYADLYFDQKERPDQEKIVRLDCTSCRAPSLKLSFKKGQELFAPVAEALTEWSQEQGNRVILLASDREQKDRIKSLFAHYDLAIQEIGPAPESLPAAVADPLAAPTPGIYLGQGWIEQSVRFQEQGLMILADHLIFDIPSRRPGRKRGGKGHRDAISMAELSPGDLVVHRDHGIGRYQGLDRMETAGVSGEFFIIEYAGGDRLYLPVDRIGLLSPYVGAGDKEPRLDKLGSRSWHNRKGRVKKALREVAHDLVQLYAQRKLMKGIAFSPPDEMFRQFEMDFPFEETRDQARAIAEVLADMEAQSPMDRLLCGDVGFGKTEVAMRAAFKAVQDGYQVAVLVPTTLLAEQHERTFRKRFRRFPVRVESLSRLKPQRVQRAIVEEVKAGNVDILIGTHKLLSMAHLFRRLGLVIIDEEHRFGVRHKEKMKQLAKEIDCLTLTATPIPRTLQLSLLGLRDLSVMETPPEGRLGVKCFLAENDDSIIRTAIERELERGGQVFLVHNRIAGLERLAETVRRLVPQARVAVAHGQMDPEELERKMIDFVRGETDCLVSTTIIESGLDIPAANTLIVHRADMLGLADLYQLRGRVGRGSTQAYAYFLVPHLQSLGKEAASRLKAFMQAAEDGGGMGLAMQDLKIRGGGNLLGLVQTGRMKDVGYDLYLELLSEAIKELRGEPIEPVVDPEVNMQLPAFIPEDYIPEVSTRVEAYRHLSMAEGEAGLAEAAAELEDRFGPIPPETRNLLAIIGLKHLLRRLGAVRMDRARAADPGRIRLVLTFGPDGPRNVEALVAMASSGGGVNFLPDQRIAVEAKMEPKGDDETILQAARAALERLCEACNQSS